MPVLYKTKVYLYDEGLIEYNPDDFIVCTLGKHLLNLKNMICKAALSRGNTDSYPKKLNIQFGKTLYIKINLNLPTPLAKIAEGIVVFRSNIISILRDNTMLIHNIKTLVK